MNQTQQLIQYKYELEDIFFSGKYSGETADYIRKQIIAVGKEIPPTKIVINNGVATLVEQV